MVLDYIMDYVGEHNMVFIGYSVFSLGFVGVFSLIYYDHCRSKKMVDLIISRVKKTKKVIKLDDL